MSQETLLNFLVLMFLYVKSAEPQCFILGTGFDEVFSVYFYDHQMPIF